MSQADACPADPSLIAVSGSGFFTLLQFGTPNGKSGTRSGVAWSDPWLESLDLEYHNLNPSRGLFHGIPVEGETAVFNREAFDSAFLRIAPADTRAHARGLAVAHCMERGLPCVFNWDSMTVGQERTLAMPDPLATYDAEVRALLAEF